MLSVSHKLNRRRSENDNTLAGLERQLFDLAQLLKPYKEDFMAKMQYFVHISLEYQVTRREIQK